MYQTKENEKNLPKSANQRGVELKNGEDGRNILVLNCWPITKNLNWVEVDGGWGGEEGDEVSKAGLVSVGRLPSDSEGAHTGSHHHRSEGLFVEISTF